MSMHECMGLGVWAHDGCAYMYTCTVYSGTSEIRPPSGPRKVVYFQGSLNSENHKSCIHGFVSKPKQSYF